jgi:hypothetical protein
MRRRLISCTALALVLGLIASAAAAQKPNSRTGRNAAYFVGNFNRCNFSRWNQQGPPASVIMVRKPKVDGACAAGLTVGPWALNGLVNPQADGAALYLPEGPFGTVGRTIWQRFFVRFKRGFRATRGEWNVFIEWHNDKGWKKFTDQVPDEPVNLIWTVRNENGVSRIAMRLIGGTSAAPRTIRVNGPRLRTDHWYDFLVRTVWSPDPKRGLVEWWLDGARLYSHHVPTLYRRPDGSVSYVYFIQDNYRRHAPFTTTIYFDGTRLGPTRSSVRR